MEPIDFSITLSDKHCDDGAEQSQQISTNDYLKRLAEYFSVEQKIDLVIYSGNIGSPGKVRISHMAREHLLVTH